MRGDWEIRCHPEAVDAFAFERDQPDLREELEGFLEACRPGMILFDVGAHYGLFALAALHATAGRTRVVAVDPSRSAIRVFDANMRLAQADGRVTRLRAAVSDRDGEAFLLSGGAGGWHMMTRATEPRPDAERLPALTLETLSRRSGLTPTHVKIDVEGDEDAVLRGGEALLRSARPILFLELHGGILRRSGRSPEAVLRDLRSLGYSTFTIGGVPVDPAAAADRDVARIICRC